MNFDWNKQVKEVLDRTEFKALSTVGKDGSWTCPVQFSYDSKLNLYSKSMPASKHMQNILQDPNVSVAIFSTNRFPDGENVAGIQLKGIAKILHSRKEVEVAAKHHYGRNRAGVDYKTRIDEHLGGKAQWNFFKVTSTEAWYFDTRFFDEEEQGRQKIPLANLHLEV